MRLRAVSTRSAVRAMASRSCAAHPGQQASGHAHDVLAQRLTRPGDRGADRRCGRDTCLIIRGVEVDPDVRHAG